MEFIIKSWHNFTSPTATVTLDAENSFTVAQGDTHHLDPNWTVPIATSAAEYASNHITVVLAGNTVPFTFWSNGESLFFSQDDSWNDNQIMDTEVNSDLQYQIRQVDEKPWIVGEVQDLG